MTLQQSTTIPEIQEAIVILRQMSADEKIRQEAYYREKRLHDEASAMGGAKREGIEIGRAEGRAEGMAEGKAEERQDTINKMRALGFTEEQIKAIYGE
ncbi:MAG: hypothetical protein MJ071_09375 [Oscillospiraceae bacterium]|nr:hypothetical protein [Oscillospiraceae bacterium]